MLFALADRVAVLHVAFAACALLVVYPYLLYPAIMRGLSVLVRVFRRTAPTIPREGNDLPSVAVLIAVFNEEPILREKIENSLRVAYPHGRITFHFGSDGSTDATPAILSQVDDPRIAVRTFCERRGKSAVLRSLLEDADAELIVFTDANTLLEPHAIRKLAEAFRDPRVGYACGRLVLQTSQEQNACNAEAGYWGLESRLKGWESDLGVLIAINGALFAVRRELVELAPLGSLTEDQVMGMQTAVQGYRGAFVRDAVGRESVSTLQGEWRRRVRISAGNFQSLGLVPAILSPRRPLVAFCFASHKLCRWLVPLWLVGLLGTSVALLDDPLARLAFSAQMIFYACGLAGLLVPPSGPIARFFRLPAYFLAMHAAVLAGLGRLLTRRQQVTWEKAQRLETAQHSTTV